MPNRTEPANNKDVQVRRRLTWGTTLAELLIAVVFTAVVAASIISTTTFAGRASQKAKERSILTSLAQNSLESAAAAAAQRTLVEGTFEMRYASSGSMVVPTGTALPTDDLAGSRAQGMTKETIITRTITRDATYADLYKVSVNGYTHDGSSTIWFETYVRM